MHQQRVVTVIRGYKSRGGGLLVSCGRGRRGQGGEGAPKIKIKLFPSPLQAHVHSIRISVQQMFTEEINVSLFIIIYVFRD